MAIDHSVLIPSLNGIPNPSGSSLVYPDQPGPSQTNALQCSYPCIWCNLNIDWLYVPIEGFDPNQPATWGPGFSLTTSEANDPNMGCIYINYDPSLS